MITAIVLSIDSVPPTANCIWRKCGKRIMLSETAKTFNRLVAAQIINAPLLPKEWEWYNVEIVVSPRTRNGDVDNRIKATLDALTKAHFWDDDKKVSQVSCRFVAPSVKGKTWIRISEGRSKFEASAPW